MLKRLMGCLAALVFLLSQISAFAEEVMFDEDVESSGETENSTFSEGSGEDEEMPFPEYSYEELTVGNPTPMEGNFFTGMWGNNTSDIDVRELLNGYNLVYWNHEEGVFDTNPASVSGIAVMDDEEGNRIYVINLYSDLKYSDGTVITARDYAFSVLLRISPLISSLGGKPAQMDFIVGYEDYLSGAAREFTGLRIIGDDELMITIRKEFLPFFYEVGLLDCNPYPIHVIAPGCEVRDDGNGAYIAGDFTEELLRETILNPETGYLSHPSVVSGPYVLKSYDREKAKAEFEANPYFKGDAYGIVPMIKKLKLISVDNENMLDMLRSGEVGLLNKVTRADKITEGIGMIGSGYYSMATYPRVGLSLISFSCERAAVGCSAVRQAVACCLDQDQLIAEYTGNYGVNVNGYYGLGQWMYQILSGANPYPVDEPEDDSAEARKAYEEELAGWEELSTDDIPTYDLDVHRANRLLDEDGWTLNEQGEPRREGEVRCREMDGEIVPLRLKMAIGENNIMRESFEKHFVPWLKQAGIELEMIEVDMETLLDQFYHRSERTVDMLYLGTNFNTLFDPVSHFQPAEDGEVTWNYTGLTDEALFDAALDLRKTESGDLLEYCRKWLTFQIRFAEAEPMIPVYSNVYFDFFPRVLHNYYPNERSGWSQAIQSAFLGDSEDEEEEEVPEEEEAIGEDEIFFDD